MKSEPFWKLVTYGGMEIPVTSSNSIRSLETKSRFYHAEADLFKELEAEILPRNPDYCPSIENLRWHHRECFVAS